MRKIILVKIYKAQTYLINLIKRSDLRSVIN